MVVIGSEVDRCSGRLPNQSDESVSRHSILVIAGVVASFDVLVGRQTQVVSSVNERGAESLEGQRSISWNRRWLKLNLTSVIVFLKRWDAMRRVQVELRVRSGPLSRANSLV